MNLGLTTTTVLALAWILRVRTRSTQGREGGGVFRSTDGGANWSAVNAGLTNRFVRALVFDPTPPSTVYAGTDGGVFKSTNSGVSWSAVSTGLTSQFVRALAVDPASPSTLYAGTENVFGGGGVFKTTNGWRGELDGAEHRFD